MHDNKVKDEKEERAPESNNKFIYLIVIVGVIIVGAVLIFTIKKPAKQDKTLSFQLKNQLTPSPTDISREVVENEEAGEEVLEMKIEDIKVGTGSEAVSGKKITVNYIGTLTDGTKFDSSYDRNEPFTFILGAGQVIQGWEQGFEGMRVGGKRKLTIPPDLGYGNRSAGSIPPNSTLIFEVELLKVE